ncbi:hypothetical protein MKZ38_007526 [Zalerion maritima]|uniref:Uncharacterized protein n=1 Tax=Zalerion maritima TaxID=339359 RepID=A0AAD5RIC8_9PEZI|nr:hypothetical protein MKZ38_007526 [Zalerion maritima]
MDGEGAALELGHMNELKSGSKCSSCQFIPLWLHPAFARQLEAKPDFFRWGVHQKTVVLLGSKVQVQNMGVISNIAEIAGPSFPQFCVSYRIWWSSLNFQVGRNITSMPLALLPRETNPLDRRVGR